MIRIKKIMSFFMVFVMLCSLMMVPTYADEGGQSIVETDLQIPTETEDFAGVVKEQDKISEEIFSAKGDDDESICNHPDEPILVSDTAASKQSEPIQTTKDFDIQLQGTLTPESKQAVFKVTALDESIKLINVAQLCKISNGKPNTDKPLSKIFKQEPGNLTFTFEKDVQLSDGDEVCLVLIYKNGNSTYTSETFTVGEGGSVTQDHIAIQEQTFTTTSKSANVVVSGCKEFENGYLFLTTGDAANQDADNRTQIASVRFNKEGKYTLQFNQNTTLKAGDTILPHLYIYNAELDQTKYKYGNPVLIDADDSQVVETRLEIATDSIRADREDVWVIADFASKLNGTLKLYTYKGDNFDSSTAKEIYSETIQPKATSQKIVFGKNKLVAGEKMIAKLLLSDGSSKQTAPKVIQMVPEKEKPTVRILDQVVTEGDTQLKVAMTIDRKTENANFVLYQFTEETLNPDTAQEIASGKVYRSENNKIIYGLMGKLEVGAKLQLVLTADGVKAVSNIIKVDPTPDWGTPTAAFETNSVQADAKYVQANILYDDAYTSMGEDFYCDVSVYQFSGDISDGEFIDGEMWENSALATRVGQINSSRGDVTKGSVKIPLRADITLQPQSRLILKVRLPHTEWEGEEVDYVSASVPVVKEGETLPDAKVILYNLDEDSSRGNRVRKILKDLQIKTETMTTEKLNETVGYLGGWNGYEAAKEPYTGPSHTTEFMLISSLSEAQLDKFLSAMSTDGLRIDHKAIVTEYNKEMKFYELIEDIEEEHEVFQALLKLDAMIKKAEKLKAEDYQTSPHWEALQKAIKEGNELLKTHEPPLEALQNAHDKVKEAYLAVTNMTELKGTAVIHMKKTEDGTYELSVEVKDGIEGQVYQYAWSNGEKTQTVHNIAAEKLIGTTVTVTANQTLGELKAQLQVPDAPKVTIQSGKNALTVKWTAPKEQDNQPAPTQYDISVYQNDVLVKTVSCDANLLEKVVDGLSSNTNYVVKVAAISAVGRSDIANVNAKTNSGGSSSGGGGSSSHSNSNQTTTIEKHDDGSVTTTDVDKKTGVVTETTKYNDGTVKTIKTDKDGIVTEINVKLSEASKNAAEKQEKPILLPINTLDIKKSQSIQIDIPSKDTKIEIPVKNATPSTVVVIVEKDGTEKIVKKSVVSENGIVLTLHEDATIKVIEHHKEFYDVPENSWAKNAIDFVASRDLFSGTADEVFSPNTPTTRGQLMSVLARLDDAVVKGDTMQKAVDWAVENGISDGNRPSDTISREQVAVMLWRYAGQPDSQYPLTNTDVHMISDYASTALSWAVEKGIMSGYPDGTLSPKATASRSHMAAMVQRYCEKLA